MVFGHLTATAAVHHAVRRHLWPALPLPLPPLVLGAYLPDLVDKPIAVVSGLAGRGYGHSLVVLLLVFGLAWALFRPRPWTFHALVLGAGLHLLQDWVKLGVLLAPLLGPIPEAPPYSFLQALLHFYRSGGVLVWLEVASILYWAVLGIVVLAGRRP
jgi:membrane-bound metal-dependent hydrolase YbcI (DUF457 family)